MIDADDFQITAGGDYSVPAVGHHGEFKISCPAAAGRSGLFFCDMPIYEKGNFTVWLFKKEFD